MISLILNVYNGEKYIDKCITSILSQTYNNFEFIIVNDGSTDNTKDIIDIYSTKDNRIRAFHTENKGISSSRAFGLTKITGEYFIFIDGDDYVDKDYLKELYDSIVKNNADLATCEYYEVRDTGTSQIKILEHTNPIDYTRDLIHGKTWCVVWNKLFKTNIVRENKISFIEGLRYWEDVPFSIIYSLYCKKITYIHKPLYHYIKNNSSSLTASEGENISFNECRIRVLPIIEKHIDKQGKTEILHNDILWLKLWIKDTFIRQKINKERILLWRNSFPEVNSQWRIMRGTFSIQYWALEKKIDFIVILIGKYWSLRHYIKEMICK